MVCILKSRPAVGLNYNLHDSAGGSPLHGFSASNIQRGSKPRREACNSPQNMAFLIRNVGLREPKIHEQRRNGITHFTSSHPRKRKGSFVPWFCLFPSKAGFGIACNSLCGLCFAASIFKWYFFGGKFNKVTLLPGRSLRLPSGT